MESEIIAFFERHAENLMGDGGSGQPARLPDFEMLPRDFIEFAERDLSTASSTHSLINATSNLKRAVDCQLDYLLCSMNLNKLYREKRLGIDRKLGLLKAAGIFRSRSIEKLNFLRNRLEHHYEVPEIQDVEVYFDLVSAFVSVIESTIPAFGYGSSFGMVTDEGAFIHSEFVFEGPELRVSLTEDKSSEEKAFSINLEKSDDVVRDLVSFSFLLRVHLLIKKLDDAVIGPRHFLSVLRGEVKI